jgi:hypothetical protein
MKQLIKYMVGIVVTSLMIAGCGGGDSTSYSLLASGQTFKQQKVNSKVDLLFVVDNSLSMLPSQTNLGNNFHAFINNFVTKGFDFQLAVTSTDSYRAEPNFANNPNLARFRDGGATHSGVFTILPSTPDLLNVFVTNATLGAGGGGDERAFSSFQSALNSSLNAGFVRDSSFLGLIILSDEDDFSSPVRPSSSYPGGDHNYGYAGLESVDSYVSYLEGLTKSSGASRRFSVSAIAVTDEACKTEMLTHTSSSIIGVRYMELAAKTDGVLGSICDTSFADTLTAIQNHILELGTQFYLDAPPIPETIQVRVNNILISQNSTNGWTYNADANSVVFHGDAIPESGAAINVTFDPKKLTF